MNLILAIDPGASGGIAFYSPVGLEAHKMPATPKDACEILTTAKGIAKVNDFQIKCYMEQVGGYVGGVGQPGSAMFNFGRNFGQLEGFLIALGIPFELVPPKTWQAAVRLHFSPVHKGDYSGMDAAQHKAEKKRVSNLNSARKRDNKNKIKERAQGLFPALKVTLNTADALMILEYGIKLLVPPIQ